MLQMDYMYECDEDFHLVRGDCDAQLWAVLTLHDSIHAFEDHQHHLYGSLAAEDGVASLARRV